MQEIKQFDKAEEVGYYELDIRQKVQGKYTEEYLSCLKNMCTIMLDLEYQEPKQVSRSQTPVDQILIECLQISEVVNGYFSQQFKSDLDLASHLFSKMMLPQ